VPVGFVGVAELSLTVAVQVVGVLVLTGDGVQVTALPVGCALVTVIAAVPELVV
jgi:hypothetical protein